MRQLQRKLFYAFLGKRKTVMCFSDKDSLGDNAITRSLVSLFYLIGINLRLKLRIDARRRGEIVHLHLIRILVYVRLIFFRVQPVNL